MESKRLLSLSKNTIAPWREVDEANPQPSIQDTWDPSILESP